MGFLIQLVAAVFLLQVAGHAQTEKPADPVVGKWYWIEEQVVECLPDGTFTVFPTQRKGKWRVVESKNELLKYEFTWDEGKFVDVLLMSRDKKSLSGKNKDKKKITATRV
ncbi:hypothetical protein GCM10023212_33850 [Luteolibacter yonseiensis]